MRIFLDTQYQTLAPRMWVPQECVTPSTYDDLLTVIPGGLVRGKGASKPEPLTQVNTGEQALQAVQFMIDQRERRTGITKINQGLNVDALNHTATGAALQQAQGQQMEEYLARNFAEAVAKLMRLKLLLNARYGSLMTMRVDGQYRQIDPTQWPESMNVVVRVGLGSGRKDQRVQDLMNMLQVQREVMLGGLPIVQPEQIYKSMAALARALNIGSPNDYVVDPSTLPPPPPAPPDLEQQKIQGMLQLNAQKLEMQGQKDAAILQLKEQEAAMKAQNQHMDTVGKLSLQAQNDMMQAHIAHQGQLMDQNLQLRKIDLAERVASRKDARDELESQAKVQKFRNGGQLDA
jgi:hypothetical protein